MLRSSRGARPRSISAARSLSRAAAFLRRRIAPRREDEVVWVGGRQVERALLALRVADPAGPAAGCAAQCCLSGVFVSLPERDRVLEHAGAVRRHMEPGQVRDASKWFTRRSHRDDDFEGGRCVGTRVHGGRCVFLNRGGLCTLQLASAREGLPQLKPFFCRLFPLTISDGVVVYDDLCEGEAACCTFTAEGPRSVLEACGPELQLALGREGYASLRALVRGSAEDVDHDPAGARPVELR